MKNILVVCGPTAVGKTNLAVKLAKEFGGEIISADSRQVYKFMDIGTGKDKPYDMHIWGYDLVRPDEEFSVSQYTDYTNQKIEEIYKRGNLPILVGGTGLYIKAVTEGLSGIDIPRDLVLRKELSEKNADELFGILKRKNFEMALSLNESDRKNPRRLVRKIEIAINKKIIKKNKLKFDDVLKIGLILDKEKLFDRIEKRVDKRLKEGFSDEISFLRKNGYMDYAPSRTLGYQSWPDADRWKLEEKKYAKRQMTWFKKEKNIHWFDVDGKDYEKKVVHLVKKWHNNGNAKKN